MTYEEARAYLSATHIYVNPSALEAVNCPFNKLLTEVNGITLLGTEQAYDAIAAKEVVAPA